eukprot:7797142-Karenia_brevis.AAC.1
MNINCEGFLVDGNGGYVKTVDQLIYLGGLLCNDGNHSRDIVRGIGEAKFVREYGLRLEFAFGGK